MVAISWISCFVSRALVACDRSWESLARRQGWREMCTFGGGEVVIAAERTGDEKEEEEGSVHEKRE